jgi:pyruvate dehydrogenase (quinone)
LPRLRQKTDGAWRKTIEDNVRAWWNTLEERAKQPAAPVNPQLVTWELSPRLPDRVIISSDSGSCANWFARDLKMRPGMNASLSGGLASMGAAVPYAIAKYAHPDRPVIALVGDGAMQMNNMAELIMVAKYWRDWQDHRWIVFVFNNEDLNQVSNGSSTAIPNSRRRSAFPTSPIRALPSSLVCGGYMWIVRTFSAQAGIKRWQAISLSCWK